MNPVSGSTVWTASGDCAGALDTDAMGDDAAGTYRAIIEGLRSGDRSVLSPSG